MSAHEWRKSSSERQKIYLSLMNTECFRVMQLSFSFSILLIMLKDEGKHNKKLCHHRHFTTIVVYYCALPVKQICSRFLVPVLLSSSTTREMSFCVFTSQVGKFVDFWMLNKSTLLSWKEPYPAKHPWDF